MKQLLWSLAVVVALFGARAAQAQGFGGYTPPPTNPYPNRPLVSPYLNMARPGSAAINYYDLVRPQMGTYNQLQQLQISTQQLTTTTNALAMQPRSGGFVTGHPVRFMDYNRYFQTTGMNGMMQNNFAVAPQQLQMVNPQRLGNLNQPR